jgi:hypothetical protein
LSVWGSWRSPGWSKEDGLATIFISLILKTYPSEGSGGGHAAGTMSLE